MKLRYLVSLSLLALAFGFFQLLGNQRIATESAKQIIARDKTGADVTGDIAALRDYVHSHMRASVKFDLTGSYRRAVEQAEAARPQVAGDLYSRAQAACGRGDSATQSQCVSRYIAANSRPGANLQPEQMPDPDKFRYSLHSPAWAPDLAGLALLAGGSGLVLAAWLALFKLKGGS
ncbi:hypothetical protein KY386_02915 [Candidatus Parcubacteria bacterium]|nr:hypothetical protein [Candidatus Parcubacteria bacterium]